MQSGSHKNFLTIRVKTRHEPLSERSGWLQEAWRATPSATYRSGTCPHWPFPPRTAVDGIAINPGAFPKAAEQTLGLGHEA